MHKATLRLRKKKIDIAKMYHRSFSTISKHAKKGSGVCIILNSLRQAGHKLKRNAKIDLGFCPLNLRKKEREETGIVMFYSTNRVFSQTTVYKLTIEFPFCINCIHEHFYGITSVSKDDWGKWKAKVHLKIHKSISLCN